MKKVGLVTIVVLILGVLVFTQITIFVVQPIGALPEGRTLVILRLSNMKFIDSADAMCERLGSGVSILCRSMMLGTVLDKSVVLLKLPYSEFLYLQSTGGVRYGR